MFSELPNMSTERLHAKTRHLCHEVFKKSENHTIIVFANIQEGIYSFKTHFEFYKSSEFYLPYLALLFVFSYLLLFDSSPLSHIMRT